MLDLPGHPMLDKDALVGGCLRLPLRVNAEELYAEVAALPHSAWATTGGRIGVHNAAQAVFLRGYAPAEGHKPIEARPALALLPYAREIIERVIPASPSRCLLARLPPLAVVPPHIDDGAPYFFKTLRIHVPVETSEHAWMLCAGQAYQMRAGEVWVLNNNAEHAVWNAHPESWRTHMICDFPASPALLALMAAGERTLGRAMPDVERHVRSAPTLHIMASG